MVERLERLKSLPRATRAERQGPLRARSPMARSPGSRLASPTDETRSFPAPPSDWRDGPAAWAIYWAHGPLGRGPEWPTGVWAYRRPLFGSVDRLGWVPDFSEYDLDIVIDIVDLAQAGPDFRAIAQIRAAQVGRSGMHYVVIVASEALTQPVAALRLALAGVTNATVQ